MTQQPAFQHCYYLLVPLHLDPQSLIQTIVSKAGLNVAQMEVSQDTLSIRIVVDGEDNPLVAWRKVSREIQITAWTLVVEQVPDVVVVPVPWWGRLTRGASLETAKTTSVHLSPNGPEWDRDKLAPGWKAIQWWGYNGDWVMVLEPDNSFPTGLWVRGADLLEKPA